MLSQYAKLLFCSVFWRSAIYSLFLGACFYVLRYEISFDWVGPAYEANTCYCLRLLFPNSSFPRFCVIFKCCDFWCQLLGYSIKLLIVGSPWSFSILVSVWLFVFSIGSYLWSSIKLPVVYLQNALHCPVVFFYITVPHITKWKTFFCIYLVLKNEIEFGLDLTYFQLTWPSGK